jgi:hypothetical protein
VSRLLDDDRAVPETSCGLAPVPGPLEQRPPGGMLCGRNAELGQRDLEQVAALRHPGRQRAVDPLADPPFPAASSIIGRVPMNRFPGGQGLGQALLAGALGLQVPSDQCGELGGELGPIVEGPAVVGFSRPGRLFHPTILAPV